LADGNDIAWFFHVVDKMKKVYGEWDFPPLIAFYSSGKYFWTDSEGDYRYMAEHISSMEMNLE
jgi:hypothetical protein